jgi:hypothetical protein
MRTQDRRGSETTEKKSQPMSAWLPELRAVPYKRIGPRSNSKNLQGGLETKGK